MTVLLDTNVVLRLLDGSGDPHHAAARRRVTEARSTGHRLVLTSATVIELAFVLRSHAAGYGWKRETIADALDALTEESAFLLEDAAVMATAITEFRHRSLDLHDCYLQALARQRGTRVLSFDDDLRRLGTGEAP